MDTTVGPVSIGLLQAIKVNSTLKLISSLSLSHFRVNWTRKIYLATETSSTPRKASFSLLIHIFVPSLTEDIRMKLIE